MRKEIVKRTLSNGIDVYLYADEFLKRMIVSYTVKYGYLGYYDEFYYEDKLYKMPPAMAHFLEHTLVETSKYGNMLHRLREKNYEMNAYTAAEHTSFYFVGIKDTWESLKELIHMVDDPGFDEKNIEKVKPAVAEEANKTMDEKYQHGYHANKRNATAAYSAYYPNYNTLGSYETTMGITIEDVQACYDAYYADENKFLTIGGNFDIDEMVDYLESIYKEIERHPNKMRPADYGDLLPIRKAYEELVKPVATDHYIVSYKIRNDFGIDNRRLDLYLTMFFKMKFGSDRPFVRELNANEVIVGGIGCTADFFQDIITITFGADVLNANEFERRIESELNSDGLEEHLFELIKKSLKVGELSKMDYIYRSLLRFPRTIDFSEKLYVTEDIEKFTLDDLRKIVDKIDWSLKTVTIIKKEKVD